MAKPSAKQLLEQYNCRDDRLVRGIDILVERRDIDVLVNCVSGMHVGNFILWRGRKVARMGKDEAWVRNALWTE